MKTYRRNRWSRRGDENDSFGVLSELRRASGMPAETHGVFDVLRASRELSSRLASAGVPLEKVAEETLEQINPEAAKKRRWQNFLSRPGYDIFDKFNDPKTGLPKQGETYWHALTNSVVNRTAPPNIRDYMPELPQVPAPGPMTITPGELEQAAKYYGYTASPDELYAYDDAVARLAKARKSGDVSSIAKILDEINDMPLWRKGFGWDNERFFRAFGMGF